MTMMQIFTDILKEYDEYVKTAESHTDSPVDGYVIMGECYEELPDIVPIDFAKDVSDKYYREFNGCVAMDISTFRRVICAIALTMNESK